MRFVTALLILVTASSLLFASQEILYSNDGEIPIQQRMAEPGEHVSPLIFHNELDDTSFHMEPGELPEGDYMGWGGFTLDGTKVFMPNRITNNVTVFDWETHEVLASIDVGESPSSVSFTEDYAIITCAFSDEVYIINLEDYSIAAVIETSEQPWKSVVNADGTRAYVGCDIEDVCEVINLETLQLETSLTGFPFALISFSFNLESQRTDVKFTNFQLTPDGNHLITGGYRDSLFVIDAATGDIEYTYPMDNVVTVELSGDGQKAVALSSATLGGIHRLDLTSFEIDASVTLDRTLSNYGLAVDQTGSKAYTGISNNESAIIRFESEDYVTFSQTYTAFWVGVSPDHTIAVNGQYRFTLVDFESESLLGSNWGNIQWSGFVSPVGLDIVGCDALTAEGMYWYDVDDPDNVELEAFVQCGTPPEGDCPRRVAITPDGTKAVVVNILSRNASIINLETYEIEAFVDLGGPRPQNVAITSDGNFAIVGVYETGTVAIIDLTTNELVASPAAGLRPGVVTISPENDYAWVGNIQSNSVSQIALWGAGSMEVTEIPTGTIGVSYMCGGIQSDVEITPSGSYVMVAASFDDQVQFINTQTATITNSVTVGDFPLSIATGTMGEDDSEVAVVTNLNDDTYTHFLFVNGSPVNMGTFPAGGEDPARVAYDAFNERFAVVCVGSNLIQYIDPATGFPTDTQTVPAVYGQPYQVEFDEMGNPLILTYNSDEGHGYLIYESEDMSEVETLYGPSMFAYNNTSRKAVIPQVSPDNITIANWDIDNVSERININGRIPSEFVIAKTWPNPFNPELNISYSLPESSEIQLTVYNVNGQKVANLVSGQRPAGTHSLTWNASAYTSGVYYLNLSSGNSSYTRKVLLVK